VRHEIVNDEQVGARFSGLGQALVAVLRIDDLEWLVTEGKGDNAPDGGAVVRDKQALGHQMTSSLRGGRPSVLVKKTL
jgi:hypothetical protein